MRVRLRPIHIVAAIGGEDHGYWSSQLHSTISDSLWKQPISEISYAINSSCLIFLFYPYSPKGRKQKSHEPRKEERRSLSGYYIRYEFPTHQKPQVRAKL